MPQALHAAFQVGLRRGPADAEQLGRFFLGPAERVHQQHDHPLLLRQPRQRPWQTRLHPRHLAVRWGGEQGAERPPAPGLVDTDPIEVSGGVVHRTHPVPVLPSVLQGLGCGIGSSIDPDRCHQRRLETGGHLLGEIHKGFDFHLLAHREILPSPR
jgi:hypothetical protein